MRRYIKLLRTFIRTALLNDWAYRSDFFFRILGTVLGLAGGIGGLYILFANKEELNGWDFAQTQAVLGVYLLIQALSGLVISPSLDQLAGMNGEIETGKFDVTLLKPISKQFYVSLRTWSLWSIADVCVGLVVLGLAISDMGMPYEIGTVALFVFSLAVGLMIYYSIMLILSSVAFWYRGTYVLWILGDIMQIGRYPMGMYPQFIRVLFMWVVPIGLVVTVPAQVLTQKSNAGMVTIAAVIAVVLFIVASAFFQKSIKKYSSASS